MDRNKIEKEVKNWKFFYGDEDILEKECVDFAEHIAKLARNEALEQVANFLSVNGSTYEHNLLAKEIRALKS